MVGLFALTTTRNMEEEVVAVAMAVAVAVAVAVVAVAETAAATVDWPADASSGYPSESALAAVAAVERRYSMPPPESTPAPASDLGPVGKSITEVASLV